MARKIEKWKDGVFPGKENIFSKYSDLTARELVIVAGATFDIALVEMIELRLIEDTKEQESFIGINGDGRAPVGAFGARIQLAFLLGILRKEDVDIFRAIKNLRNIFAHKVEATFLSDDVVKELKKLNYAWRKQGFRIRGEKVMAKTKDHLGDDIGVIPEAGEGLLLAVFAVHQSYLHGLSDKITRIKKIS